MRQLTRTAVGLLATVVLLAAGQHMAGAAAATPVKSLTITPAASRPTVQPGGTLHGNFQILNQGQDAYDVSMYTAPYFVRSENYTPDFTPLPGRLNASDWLTLDTKAATVQPGKSVNVNYDLQVPAGTHPGGYYVVAFVQTKGASNGQGVIINERVGEIFYIRVAGPVYQAGKLSSWSSNFWQKPPLAATLRLEDSGNLHYLSDIQIVVRDLFGNPKYTLNTQKEILPQTIRRIQVNWDKAPAFGLFKVTGHASVLGKTQTLPTKYVLVVAQPLRVALLVVIFLLACFVLIRIVLRRRRQKHV
jgi:hypothetical protein